jgi:hypothetical protein
MRIILERSDEKVRTDLEEARAGEISASELKRQAETLESRVKAQIEVKKKEIEALKARVKLDKDRKDEAARLESERELKAGEAALKLLEKQREVREAEKNLADAIREFAGSTVRFHERELERTKSREDLMKQMSSSVMEVLVRKEKEHVAVERKVLDALIDQVSRREEVVKREKELLNRRFQLFEMQTPSS